MTIVGTLKIMPLPERRGEVMEILRSVQGRVRTEPGCEACNIYEAALPDDAVLVVERWDSDTALEAHLRSEAYRRILGAIEISGAAPEIRFDHVSRSEGLERIERARGAGTDLTETDEQRGEQS